MSASLTHLQCSNNRLRDGFAKKKSTEKTVEGVRMTPTMTPIVTELELFFSSLEEGVPSDGGPVDAVRLHTASVSTPSALQDDTPDTV
jgi:hypothetical protein